MSKIIQKNILIWHQCINPIPKKFGMNNLMLEKTQILNHKLEFAKNLPLSQKTSIGSLSHMNFKFQRVYMNANICFNF